MVGMLLGVAFGVIASIDATIFGTGILALGIVGWIDDKRGLHPAIRLATHFTVALWTLIMFQGLTLVRDSRATPVMGVLVYVACAVAIVWSINLFNFMDGIDGLAGSQAGLIFGVVSALLFHLGDESLGILSAVIATSCGGFLAWNWPPAKIFMGDVGSGAIGYLVAGVAIASSNHHSVPLLAFAVLYGLFIVDATITLARRIGRGHQAIEAHREHTYQRLSVVWGRHSRVTLAASVVTLFLAALCVVGTSIPRLLVPTFVIAYSALLLLVVISERIAPM
jgi:Fuc2NAc and GlcNAc transferase